MPRTDMTLKAKLTHDDYFGFELELKHDEYGTNRSRPAPEDVVMLVEAMWPDQLELTKQRIREDAERAEREAEDAAARARKDAEDSVKSVRAAERKAVEARAAADWLAPVEAEEQEVEGAPA